ncbi:GNAT family N-acetyltransferase [Aquimarina algiphila]|uniref:GNAT family N-acetyltransferase n=1 Tax=Aquimarina algiphila TaxID=2047982 RepID=UPI00232B61FB|nr:GNAT family N-acetyltransferase [Aquimarina algiphila]
MIPAIQHQFEFWRHLGQMGGYFNQYEGVSSLFPKDTTWPSKIFDLKEHHIIGLKNKIASYQLAKSVAVEENETLENLLQAQGFRQTSSVAAMTMHNTAEVEYANYPEIEKVMDAFGAKMFAKIASKSFGYTIYESTIAPLIHSKKVQLFIGRYQRDYVSCGIVFQDSIGDFGLHMIGTKRKFRGFGLGKKMTEHLLATALKNDSEFIHLAASKLGAPIYHKLGFQHQGYLKSYTI